MINKNLTRAIATYDQAWAEAVKYAQEMIDATEMAEIVGSNDAYELFKRKADRAATASENWMRSAELARKVMDEIQSGRPTS